MVIHVNIFNKFNKISYFCIYTVYVCIYIFTHPYIYIFILVLCSILFGVPVKVTCPVYPLASPSTHVHTHAHAEWRWPCRRECITDREARTLASPHPMCPLMHSTCWHREKGFCAIIQVIWRVLRCCGLSVNAAVTNIYACHFWR